MDPRMNSRRWPEGGPNVDANVDPNVENTRDERRRAPRASFGRVFVNKYIDGWPHLVALMELSASGMLVRKLHEPDLRRDYFPIELALPWRPTEERIWLWTRTVRESGGAQALRFLGMSDEERATIEAIVREVRTAA